MEVPVMGHANTYDDIDDDTQPQDPALPKHSAGIRVGRELLKATEPFAVESVPRSWWEVGSTFVLMIAALIAASSSAPP